MLTQNNRKTLMFSFERAQMTLAFVSRHQRARNGKTIGSNIQVTGPIYKVLQEFNIFCNCSVFSGRHRFRVTRYRSGTWFHWNVSRRTWYSGTLRK